MPQPPSPELPPPSGGGPDAPAVGAGGKAGSSGSGGLPISSRAAPVDDVFEHYRVLRRGDGSLWELGHGAMGVTYKAVDTNLDKLVALKLINAQFLDKESARERFRREARAAASLEHRNVARVYHLGQSGGTFFYAMEYVGGNTVEDIVRRDGPLPWRNALGIALQISRALIAVHASNLVHRDIKPANVMVVDEVDETNVAKLIDFGLAKSAAEEAGVSRAGSNASGFLGTPLYASPEQCEELPADIRSDIYSLGVTLWYLLTGHPTFEGNLARVFYQQLHAAPPLEKLPADLPAAVRALLERMLAKDRAGRPQTPADLRQQIEDCLRVPANTAATGKPPGGPTRAKPPVLIVKTKQLSPPKLPPVSMAPPERKAGPARGKRLPVLLFAGLLALAALWTGLRWLTHRQPPPAVIVTNNPTPAPSPRAAADTPAPSPAVAKVSTPPPATPSPALSALLARARASGKTADYLQIINAYDAVLAAAPNTLEAWTEIGVAYRNLHQEERSQAAMQRAVAIPAAGPRDSCYLSTAYTYLNRPDDARKAGLAGLNFAPRDALDYENHGVACFWLRQYDRALQDFNEVVRFDPGDANAVNSRGYLHDVLGQSESALEDYGRAIRLNPGHAIAFQNRGVLRAKLKQYNLALQDFTEVIRLDPNSAAAFGSRGFTYNVLTQYRLALQDFDVAIRLRDNEAGLYNGRGFAWLSLKQYAAAIQDFNRAVTLNGNNPLFYENRAFAEAASGYNTAADNDQARARHLRLQRPGDRPNND